MFLVLQENVIHSPGVTKLEAIINLKGKPGQLLVKYYILNIFKLIISFELATIFLYNENVITNMLNHKDWPALLICYFLSKPKWTKQKPRTM